VPLDRDHVTIASRIMLPAHVLLSAWVGAAWMFQGAIRTQVPALYALRHVWPLPATGFVLALGAVVVVGAMLSKHRAVAAIALGASGLMYLVLTGFVVAAFFQDAAGSPSFAAPAWTLYPAVAHLASLASLAFDELTDDSGNTRREHT
jgi:hypothetical protein